MLEQRIPATLRGADADGAPLSTESERSGFQRTGRYEEVGRLAAAFQARYPDKVAVRSFGTTPEGRPMQLLVVTASGSPLARAGHAEALRLVRAYGTRARQILGKAESRSDLGQDFGAGLTAAEVDYLLDREWACSAADILWRRSKLGLHASARAAVEIDKYIASQNYKLGTLVAF